MAAATAGPTTLCRSSTSHFDSPHQTILQTREQEFASILPSNTGLLNPSKLTVHSKNPSSDSCLMNTVLTDHPSDRIEEMNVAIDGGSEMRPVKTWGAQLADVDADVTMCICPVCGFSASSPLEQDIHMESAHGESLCNNTFATTNETDNLGSRLTSTKIRPHPTTSSTPHRLIFTSRPSMPPISLAGTNAISPGTTPPPISASPVAIHDSPLINPSQIQLSFSGGNVSITGCHSSAYSTSPEDGVDVSPTVLTKVDSRRRYRCNVCPATFPWHGDLTEHLRLKHGMQKSRENTRNGKAGSFRCVHCKYVAKYQSELRRHMRLHWGVKPFACVFCPYRSAWKGDLKRHMESHHRDQFSSDAELTKIMSQFKNNAGTVLNGVPIYSKPVNEDGDFHTQNYHPRSPSQFSNQSNTFTESHLIGYSDESYTEVDTDHHKPQLQTEVSNLEQSQSHMTCHICSYTTQSLTKYNNHITNHLNSKQFKCPLCEHRSNYKWDVKKHLKIHHPNFPNLNVISLTESDEMKRNVDSSTRQHSSLLTPESGSTDFLPYDYSLYGDQNCQRDKVVDEQVDQKMNPIDLSVRTKQDYYPMSLDLKLSATNNRQHNHHHHHHHHQQQHLSSSSSVTPVEIADRSSSIGTELDLSPTTTQFDKAACHQSGGMNVATLVGPMDPVVNSWPNPNLPVGAIDAPINTMGLFLNQWLMMNGLLQSWQNLHKSAQTQPQAHTTLTPSLVSIDPSSSLNAPKISETIDLSVDKQSDLPPMTPLTEWSAPSEANESEYSIPRIEESDERIGAIQRHQVRRQPSHRGRRMSAPPRCHKGGCPKEEQWKRYQCSGCGHRSNWKWDINKHIKVAHPERTNITTITLDLEEARLTFPHYMNRLKLSRHRFGTSTSSEKNDSAIDKFNHPTSGSQTVGHYGVVGEGYYRPFKCSTCGHRSNWKWDVRKHIKQMHHNNAEVVTLTVEEARRTIHQYKSCRRQHVRHTVASATKNFVPRSIIPRSSNERTVQTFAQTQVEAPATQEQSSHLSARHSVDPINSDRKESSNTTIKSKTNLRMSFEKFHQLRFTCRLCRHQFGSCHTLAFHAQFRHSRRLTTFNRKLVFNQTPIRVHRHVERKPLPIDGLVSTETFYSRKSEPLIHGTVSRLSFQRHQDRQIRSHISKTHENFEDYPKPLSDQVALLNHPNLRTDDFPNDNLSEEKIDKLSHLLDEMWHILNELGYTRFLNTAIRDSKACESDQATGFSDYNSKEPLDSSTSSNEENHARLIRKGKTRSVFELLKHPSVGPRLVRLENLLHYTNSSSVFE